MSAENIDLPDQDLMAFCSILQHGLVQLFPENASGLDSGGGFHSRDFWVKYGDSEFFITVKKSNNAKAAEGMI